MVTTTAIISLSIGLAIGVHFKHRPVQMATAFFIAVFGLSANLVGAAGGDSPIAQDHTIIISATGVAMVVGIFIPLVTGYLTRLNVSSAWKGFITLVLNLINGLITSLTLADGTAVLSWQTFFSWFVGFIASVATYAGIWRPAGLTSSMYVPNPAQPQLRQPGKLANKGVQ